MERGRPAEYLCHMSFLGYDVESCSHLVLFQTWLMLNKNWICFQPFEMQDTEGGYVFKDSGFSRTGIFPDLDLSKNSLGDP